MQFTDLVDRLLTDFLLELGVSSEDFFDLVSKASDTDQLSSFVVQTILTVDDFLLFKAMMVKRNTDLTNQVCVRGGDSRHNVTMYVCAFGVPCMCAHVHVHACVCVCGGGRASGVWVPLAGAD